MATATLLQLKTLFWRYQGQLWTGTATSGSTSSLVDPALVDLASTEFPFPMEGKQLRVTQTIADLRRIVKVDHATGTLYPGRAFSSAITTNSYEVWGNSIDGGQQLTDLFNQVLQVARPLVPSEVTIVTGQHIYDVTSLVTSPDDVVGVYVRLLDPADLIPYKPLPLPWFDVYPTLSAGVQVMNLEIDRALTLNSPETEELWIEHYKALTDFTNDTSTVDETYAEWLAWEAVLLHALDKATGQTDKGRWGDLAKTAGARVRRYRDRFMPHRPLRPMHGRPQVM